MKIRIRGEGYKLTRHKRLPEDAFGDTFRAPNRIRIAAKAFADPVELLDTLIHECLHAAFWDLDEEAVHDAATDMAAVLTRFGVVLDPKKVRALL